MGRINIAAMQSFMAQLRTSADDLPPLLKCLLLLAEHLRDEYLGTHYGKAHNLRLELRRMIEEALSSFDLLLTPTTPTVAFEVLERRAGMIEMIGRIAGNSVFNTCPLDLTGHPALTVPAGIGAHGLPVGLQIIGPRMAEDIVYQTGAFVEGSIPSPTIARTTARAAAIAE
jgi:amidase